MPALITSRFNARSTAEEVIEGVDLSGKVAVITGGAAGLGKETARVLALAGADVIIGARNKQALDAAVDELNAAKAGRVTGYKVDLLSLHSVNKFACQVRAARRSVDLLILNAAVMACPLSRNRKGIERHFATNFVGHAFLSSKLAGLLLKSKEPRVISLSSTAHQMSPIVFEDINFEHRAYDPWDAYAQSKTATALLAAQIWNELGAEGVTAHTLHPGGVQTGLLKHINWDMGAQFAVRYNYDVANSKVKTIEQGAATTVWAATEVALLHRETAYLEDCQVSEILQKPIYSNGVMPYALDPENARMLWAAAEELSGATMSLSPKSR